MKYLPGVLAMAALVALSNILVQHQILDGLLTLGAFTYPFTFLITDLTNRLQGAQTARRVVVSGFAVGLICSFIAWRLDATTFRIALGSGAAFLAAQLLDITVFNRLRQMAWWKAPFISTLAGSTLDTLVFFSVAFAGVFTFLEPAIPTDWAGEAVPLLRVGPMLPLWVSLACADWLVKLAIDLVALIPFRLVVARFVARVA